MDATWVLISVVAAVDIVVASYLLFRRRDLL